MQRNLQPKLPISGPASRKPPRLRARRPRINSEARRGKSRNPVAVAGFEPATHFARHPGCFLTCRYLFLGRATKKPKVVLVGRPDSGERCYMSKLALRMDTRR